MKAGWGNALLGDVCEILDSRRKPVTKKDRRSGDFPYYGATGIVDYVDEFIFDEPLVLVGEDGAKWGSGESTAFSVSGRCWVNNHAHVLRPIRAKLLDDWLVYYLVHEDLSPFVSGLTVPKLNQGNLREIPILLPPLDEQQRIVAILDEAFEGIATAKANAEKNLQNARELFDSDLQRTFAQAPPGADFATLGEVCKFIGGSQPPKSEFVSEPRDGYVRLIQIRDYKSDKKAVYIPKSLARRFCAADDVMIGRYGPPLFQILRGLEGAYNVALMKAVPDETVLSKRYLFHFLRHRDMLNYIIAASARAAGQIGLNKETIEPYPIYIPDLSVQEAIVSRIEELEDATQKLIRIAEQRLAAFDELKKSLLHQAFSGQL